MTLEDTIEITEGDIAEAEFYGDSTKVAQLKAKLAKLKSLAEQLGLSQDTPTYSLAKSQD